MKVTGEVFKARDYVGGANPSTTTVEDESRYGNDLTFAVTAAWSQLPSGLWKMNFDGDSDYASKSIANFRQEDYAGTMLAWIKFTNATAAHTISASADEGTDTSYLIFYTLATSGFLQLAQQNAGDSGTATTGDTDVCDNTWRLVALTSSGTAWALYVNGVVESLTPTGANNGDWFGDTTLRDNITVGALIRSSTANYALGSIGKFRVYNYALSVPDIANIFQAERHWFGV